MTNVELIRTDEIPPTAHGGPEAPPTAAVTLFGSDDPMEVVRKAKQTASALMGVVRESNLAVSIGQGVHLRIEAWTLLGSMLGVFPRVVWTHQISDGWEARVEVVNRQGQVIGAAESMCTHSESTWKTRDEHALRSMSQTRAASKALGTVLRFVAVLAGFSGTPAEEMPTEPRGKASGRPRGATASQREPVEEIPGTDRPFREGDLCPACALDGNKTSRGGRPAFFVPKQGPHAGQLQCNGRTPEGGWCNHPAPISPQEAATADDNPANEAEIPRDSRFTGVA